MPFFTKILFFILQQCLDPNPYQNPNFFRIRIRIRAKLADFFGFGSTTLILVKLIVQKFSKDTLLFIYSAGRQQPQLVPVFVEVHSRF
jgi:hypothetical protein